MRGMKGVVYVITITISVSKCENDINSTRISDVTEENNKTNNSTNVSINWTNDDYDFFSEKSENLNDLNFEYDDDDDLGDDDDVDDVNGGGKISQTKIKESEFAEKQMQDALLKAMNKPMIRKQIAEVIPILRVMSPAQRLTLAALVSSQIMSQKPSSETNLSEIATMFAGKNSDNENNRKNVTEYLLLPISVDIAKMFRGLGREVGRNLKENIYKAHETNNENTRRFKRRHPSKPNNNNNNKSFHSHVSSQSLPSPSSPPPSLSSISPKSIYSTTVSNRRKDDVEYYVYEEENSSSSSSGIYEPSGDINKQPGNEECDFFTKSLCLEVSNYPTEAIISSLKKNLDIAKTFLADFSIPSGKDESNPNKISRLTGRRLEVSERRQDDKNDISTGIEGGYMCPSSVKFARPKRARTTAGNWKYIVNTGDYTQTLRLEICMKPKTPCSFVTNHLSSECAQVFNYHRLLTWDESKGLHMDVFKVPSCCSCHIQGYTNFYPPNDEYAYAEKRKEPQPTSEYPVVIDVVNNRETPIPIPLGGIDNTNEKPQVFYTANIMNENLPEHLVPPGPPLPLENEYYHKKGPLEHNTRHSVPVESTRNKITQEQIVLQQRPNLIIPQIHHSSSSSSPLLSPSEFESKKQSQTATRYVLPLINVQQQQQQSIGHYNDYKKIKPVIETGIYSNPNNDLLLQSASIKYNSRTPLQQYYNNRKYNDNKSLSSRINPIYATPPKIREKEIKKKMAAAAVTSTTTTTTTASPKVIETISSSGHKINYNYHPIIDFFKTETNKKKTKIYHNSSNFRLSSPQDWTPVLNQQTS
ncbi:conserved hypothetical protein [Pediculus humanus corporis]|uniref:Uncharacterized protein n=1 Tax=Pediculus humanus subsp. corporis TaxID=121224 RepID=E0VBC4_PEDHC|nr:uncharacterized protein Phum_PHUM057390 [Pediculus humanus corporis]EEB10680.1 conserved hypothetical protein [Pediculus humanus corporis]